MARHEKSRQPLSGEPLSAKVRVRKGADGKPEIVRPKKKTASATEPAERPPQPEDPNPFAGHGPYAGI
jgi:hypothetical protein